MEADIRAGKRELRARMRAVLAGLSGEVRARESGEACAALAREYPPHGGLCVLATLPIAGEIDLRAYLREVLSAGGGVVLPRVEPNRAMSLWRVAALDGIAPDGPLGLREPDARTGVPVEEGSLNLALVPGLAFDVRGGRLGRGGGYFDRLLTRLAGRMPLVATCHSCQVLGDVPLEPHDVRVDRIIAAGRVLDVRD